MRNRRVQLSGEPENKVTGADGLVHIIAGHDDEGPWTLCECLVVAENQWRVTPAARKEDLVVVVTHDRYFSSHAGVVTCLSCIANR